MTAMEVDKTPVRAEAGTDGEQLYPDASRSLANLRHMRLMALLRDMIDNGDGAKAAETLGVSYRTVSRTVESGRLTERMSAALERHLLLGGGLAAAQHRARVEALEERVAALEGELRGRIEAVEGGSEAMREEQARAMRQVERRLVRLEAGKGAQDEPERASPASGIRPWAEVRHSSAPSHMTCATDAGAGQQRKGGVNARQGHQGNGAKGHGHRGQGGRVHPAAQAADYCGSGCCAAVRTAGDD